MALIRDGVVIYTAAEVIGETGSAVVVRHEWREANTTRVSEAFQVLRLSRGKVVDIQDHRDLRRALRSVEAPA